MKTGLIAVLLSVLAIATPAARAQLSTLDITDNALVLDYTEPDPDPTAEVRSYIIAGRGTTGLGATWTGTGITSSTVAADVLANPESTSVAYAHNGSLPLGPYVTFEGRAVDNTAVLIRYTRTGDANLDGLVDDNDVTILGATYAPGISQPAWALGDFDYNGFVDDDDVSLLGAFYDPDAAPIEPGASAAPGAVPAAHSSLSAVPEPATWLLLLFGATVTRAFRWYRRCRKT
jgi:hypothetical protein